MRAGEQVDAILRDDDDETPAGEWRYTPRETFTLPEAVRWAGYEYEGPA